MKKTRSIGIFAAAFLGTTVLIVYPFMLFESWIARREKASESRRRGRLLSKAITESKEARDRRAASK